MIPPWLASLEDHAIAITPNQRLARRLALDYQHDQRANGKLVWTTPRILPWKVWLQEAWNQWQLHAAPDEELRLLTPLQARWLWEDIVRRFNTENPLLLVGQTARAAYQAWQLVHEWGIALPFPSAFQTSDSEAFCLWSEAYRQHCADHQFLDPAQLPQALLKGNKNTLFSPKIVLVGFDYWTPQQESFIEALRQQGHQVHNEPFYEKSQAVYQVAFSDPEQELRSVANWARAQIEHGSAQSVGIVVPDLAQQRDEIVRILGQVLQPSASFTPAHQSLFNLSLGQALSHYPLIYDALLLLGNVNIGTNPWPRLLHSPYLGGATEEREQRVLLEASLRQWVHAAPPMATVEVQAIGNSSQSARGCPRFAEILHNWRSVCATLPERQSPSKWAKTWHHLLQLAGWPGDQAPNSEEYQTVQAWQTCLQSLQSLDVLNAAWTFQEAWRATQRLANEQIFQPEAHFVPVQVLGLLEAAGQRFDALWVMGMSDSTWPAPIRPNPLIPIPLQRAYNIPQALPVRNLVQAKRLFARLCSGAEQVIFSYPQQDAQHPLSPSPLLHSLPYYSLDTCVTSPYLRPGEAMLGSATVEYVTDDHGPPLDTKSAPGGTRLFEDQAQCPFRAFARHRLQAKPLPQIANGPDALVRGNLVHALLEQLWRTWGQQSVLSQLDIATRQRHVTQAVQQVLDQQPQHAFPVQLRELEFHRLTDLAVDWLKLELDRPPFHVMALERKQTITIGGITIQARIDRIDRLQDGSLLIIDYKTGKVSPSNWFGQRPSQPQLPLYAVALDANAIAFAQIIRHQCQWIGYSAEPTEISKVRVLSSDVTHANNPVDGANWPAQIEAWRSHLTQLAVQFRNGYAAIDPLSKACQQCDLSPLCRVYAGEL